MDTDGPAFPIRMLVTVGGSDPSTGSVGCGGVGDVTCGEREFLRSEFQAVTNEVVHALSNAFDVG